MFSNSLQPKWVTLGQISMSPSACELEQGPQRGAWQPCGGGGCWTLVCSADDALIQFPTSVLHLGYADREYPAAKQEKNPQICMLGVCTSFSSAVYKQCKWNWAAGCAGRRSSHDLPGQTCHCGRAVGEPGHPLPRGQLVPTAWLCANSARGVLPTDGCLAALLSGPACFSRNAADSRAALLLSMLVRRACHGPGASKCITLSPHGSTGILLQESAMLGWFLVGTATQGCWWCGQWQQAVRGCGACRKQRPARSLNWTFLPGAPWHRAPGGLRLC